MQIADAKAALHDTLRSFSGLGAALLEARGEGTPLENAIMTACGWRDLEGRVATALQLTPTMAANPLSHAAQGNPRFRRYAPRMLRALDIQAAPVGDPLVEAAQLVAEGREVIVRPTTFLRRRSKWHQQLQAQAPDDRRLWEVAVLFHLHDAFRSGDIWLAHSRRSAELKQALVPIAEARATPRLTVPFDPADWLTDRKARMAEGLMRVAAATRAGAIPGGSIEGGMLKINRLTAAVPT